LSDKFTGPSKSRQRFFPAAENIFAIDEGCNPEATKGTERSSDFGAGRNAARCASILLSQSKGSRPGCGHERQAPLLALRGFVVNFLRGA
jgi:hypothetical protein